MTVQINYKSSILKKVSSNLILFVDEKFNIIGLKKQISNSEFSYISDLLKTSDLKKDLLFFEINSKKSIFLVSIKKDAKIYVFYFEGNDFRVKNNKINDNNKNQIKSQEFQYLSIV